MTQPASSPTGTTSSPVIQSFGRSLQLARPCRLAPGLPHVGPARPTHRRGRAADPAARRGRPPGLPRDLASTGRPAVGSTGLDSRRPLKGRRQIVNSSNGVIAIFANLSPQPHLTRQSASWRNQREDSNLEACELA
jgi:hypothetical protein